MDNAVALVQAYLRVNGYLTVTEYPVVEALPEGGLRCATDLDVLAFRFAEAADLMPDAQQRSWREHGFVQTDPALRIADGEADMIVGEVKEGHAELNRGAVDRGVLTAALARFGCCPRSALGRVVEDLVRSGQARTPDGHRR